MSADEGTGGDRADDGADSGAVAPGRRRGRSARAQARLAQLEGREDAFVMYFKERVYATFTGLALVLVVMVNEHADAEHALFALLLGVLGITAAGFVSDVVSHLAMHREFPGRVDLAIMGSVAGGALGT